MNNQHLLVAATKKEFAFPFESGEYKSKLVQSLYNVTPDFTLLFTGVGQFNTIKNLLHYIHTYGKPLDLINIGVAGSFNPIHKLGSICKVITDTSANQIVERNNKILTWQEAGIPEAENNTFTPQAPAWSMGLNLAEVIGITSDTITDDQLKIQKLRNHFNADTESMEGAAVFYIAEKMDLPALQIRTISNMVGENDKN
jgi:futalosine hydrolase